MSTDTTFDALVATIGPWPFPWLPKTDSERVQNVPQEFFDKASRKAYEWYATEKIDGMSATYVLEHGGLRVCSRNFELKDEPGSLHMRVANDIHLVDLMKAHNLQAVQGEVFGEGIQGNRLEQTGQKLRLFDAWRRDGIFVKNMFYALHMSDELRKVAVPFQAFEDLPGSSAEFIEGVDGMRSLINPDCQAEGLVFHNDFGKTFAALGNRGTFKVINPQYLIKHKI